MAVTQAFYDWMDELIPDTMWVGLFHTDPSTMHDPLSVELVGRAYARQPVVMSEGRNRISQNDVIFAGLPRQALVSAIGMFDDDVNGNLRYFSILATPIAFPKGGTYTVHTGGLQVNFPGPAPVAQPA